MNYSNSANWTGHGGADEFDPAAPRTPSKYGYRAFLAAMVLATGTIWTSLAVTRDHLPSELAQYHDYFVAPPVVETNVSAGWAHVATAYGHLADTLHSGVATVVNGAVRFHQLTKF